MFFRKVLLSNVAGQCAKSLLCNSLSLWERAGVRGLAAKSTSLCLFYCASLLRTAVPENNKRVVSWFLSAKPSPRRSPRGRGSCLQTRGPLVAGSLIVVIASTISPTIAAAQDLQRSSSTTEAASELRRAADLLQSGDLDEAEPILHRVLASNPNNADAHNLLGVILDQRGKTAEAEREYRAALRLNPNHVSALANLGVLLAHSKREDEGIKTFESVRRLAPDHPQATINLGLLYSARNDYQRATELLARANELQPHTFDISYQLGLALYNLKRLDDAVTAFESAVSVSPHAAEPIYFLGVIAFERGRDEAASDLLKKALVLRSDYPEANFMLGELSAKHQDYSAARDYYERAWRQDPTLSVYYIRLGGVYLLLGNFNQAMKIFQSAAERFPAIAEIHYFTAIAARGVGNYDLALAELQTSLALQPNSADSLALSGAINLDRANLTEAEKLLRRALTFNQQHFNAQYDLGRLLVKTNRYAEALPLLQRAAEINPNSVEVHYQLYLALSRLKRKTDADHELEIYKQLREKEKVQKLIIRKTATLSAFV